MLRRVVSTAKVEKLEGRQLLSAASTPYLASPYSAGQTIEAENFDRGGEGVAYHVTQQPKSPNAYRPGDAVVIQPGGTNGYDVGSTTTGEWLQYTVTIPAAARYTFEANVANPAAGAVFHADVDLANVTQALSAPKTAGWQSYQTVSSGSFSLSAGTHLLRVYFDHPATNGAVGNFDSFKLQEAAGTSSSSSLHLTWHSVAPIPQGLTEGAGDAVNGKLYVFSGFINTTYYPTSRVYCYDPSTNVWTRLKDMPVATTHAGTAVIGQYIYMAGGYPPNAAHTYQVFQTANVWRFDTVNDTWAAMPSLPQAHGAGQLAVVGNTLHYFSGDDSTRADRHEHWALNLSNLAAGWTACARIPTARNRLGAVSLNGRIYAIGGAVGQDAQETTQSVVEVYNPATNSWSEAAPLPSGRALLMAACTVYDGQIIVAGGETTFSHATTQVTSYNPSTNTWTQLTPLPLGRIGGICQNLGGMLIFTTGHPGFNANTWIGTFS